ncbi:MAG: hypothetical protein AB7S92_19705 [Parvibaculaceae bacterium]
MADYESDGGEIDPPAGRGAGYWLDCIAGARKVFALWQEKADGIDRAYADLARFAAANGDREYRMFWANLEVLKPSIYSRPPSPVVVPRWQSGSELARKASEVLERALSLAFEETGLDAVMLQVRDDVATVGRGAAWIRLEAGEGGDRSVVEHVDRADFLHEPARKWEEVGWVARRAWLTRAEVRRRFGDEAARAVALKVPRDGKGEALVPDHAGEPKAEIWEIWSKTKGCVVWVSPGLEEVLDLKPPFLRLDRFFPCPRPAYATLERHSLVPVPDFYYYRDQLEEINELTARISALAEALRLKGFYPGGAGELGEAIEAALKDTSDNARAIPVANFAALGGASLRDSIIWLPIVEVANTISSLVLLRKQLIDDVYQITGLSDIMRGATDPNETLGAQQLKSQYGSIRIRDRQAELIRFARDLTRLSAEIMAENYTPSQFDAMAGMGLPSAAEIAGRIEALGRRALDHLETPQGLALRQDPEALAAAKQGMDAEIEALAATITMDKVVSLLREQRLRPFVLEIETDSTIRPDENAEKQGRSEFLAALSGALQQLVPLVSREPAAAPFAAEILKFSVAPFRAGRGVQGAIESFAETVKEGARRAAADAGAAPEQIEARREDAKLAFDRQKHEDEMALRREMFAHRRRLETLKARADAGPGPPPSGEEDGAPPVPASAYSREEMLEGLALGQARIAEAIRDLAQAIAAPKSVTTPDGRTYTTSPARMN